MSAAGELFDLVRDSVIVRDVDGRIRAWNAASADLYGWSADVAVGRSLDDLFPGSVAPTTEALVERLRTEGAFHAVLERSGAGGRTVLADVRSVLRRNPDGDDEIVEIGRDITERRRTEEALKRSELRYSSLFQAMAAAFWELDFAPVGALLRDLKSQGVEDFPLYFGEHPEIMREMMRRTRVVEVNDTTLSMFGIGDRSRLAPSVEPYWSEESTDVFAGAVMAAIGRKGSYMKETRLRRDDGSEFDVLFTAAFPHEGLAQGALLVGVIDISERKAAMAELRQLQSDFAHAARVSLLGELSASLAHEVNQPLAAMSANASASLRWLRRETPDLARVDDLTQRIIADARRAADVIARVRGMAGNREGRVETLSIRDLVEETATFLKHELQAQEALLQITVPDQAFIRADRTQIQQVLVNLIMNALQATGDRRTRPVVRLSAGTVDEEVELTVADNGPGLPPEVLERLFTSFYTTRAEGMGLGLPICRSIIEAHGGRIDAGNNPDGGAIFRIRLPSETAHTKV